MKGRIHSIESMGLVDGPGIRTVVFFQGCPLRCAYCHNPDTWNEVGGIEFTPEELLKKILRFKPYFDKSGGGVTFSGGEPLLQPDFLLEILKLCKENGIHTVLDTSGYGLGNYEDILKYTDLILPDIKQVSDIGYKKLTGKNMEGLKLFLDSVSKSESKLWIRHVVVPGITDSDSHIESFANYIKPIKNVEKVELLPYHTFGIDKYSQLGIQYRLANVEPMSKIRTLELTEIVNSILKDNK